MVTNRHPHIAHAILRGLTSRTPGHLSAGEPKRAHLRVPAFKNTTKIQREDTQEREERMKIVAGEGKKKERFWAVRRRGGPGEGTNTHSRHTQQTHTADTHRRHTPQTHTADTHRRHTPQTHTADTHRRHTPQTHTADTHRRHTPKTHTADTHSRHTQQTHTADTHSRHTQQTHTATTHNYNTTTTHKIDDLGLLA